MAKRESGLSYRLSLLTADIPADAADFFWQSNLPLHYKFSSFGYMMSYVRSRICRMPKLLPAYRIVTSQYGISVAFPL